MSPREVLFITNLISMVLCGVLAWAFIFLDESLPQMRKVGLIGLCGLFSLRLFAVFFATLTMGPAWQN